MASKKKSSKSKPYTSMEKKVFLQILDKYKHVIKVKKNDGTTLKDKDVAWCEICNEFNQSTLRCHERTVQHVKKLWAKARSTRSINKGETRTHGNGWRTYHRRQEQKLILTLPTVHPI
ncbi:uncharacterized protein LOC112455894 isoform X1 [Temnothorax curvispinosus]|uniref:Regulatory protein zeste n=1 Tax=Temnothorax curvispinosus TaxID=300111 RepID=A0A6J1PXE2_9HYME|nr:uncharacterized protein LOC112455894 isoform X1 [Temnothorax curvispinosus]